MNNIYCESVTVNNVGRGDRVVTKVGRPATTNKSSCKSLNWGAFDHAPVLKDLQLYTVEPPNKGHFGDNINSAVVSFVERSIILCPFVGGSTFGGSTVVLN